MLEACLGASRSEGETGEQGWQYSFPTVAGLGENVLNLPIKLTVAQTRMEKLKASTSSPEETFTGPVVVFCFVIRTLSMPLTFSVAKTCRKFLML